MEILDYAEMENEAIEFISKNKIIILATSAKNRVTARMVSIINNGFTVYFQTGKDSVKYKQIKENPNVALCTGNMQIEGIASIKCHPLQDPFFVENFSKRHKGSFNTYSHLKSNIIVEIQPKWITFWKYDDENKPFRDILDIGKQEALREYYNIES